MQETEAERVAPIPLSNTDVKQLEGPKSGKVNKPTSACTTDDGSANAAFKMTLYNILIVNIKWQNIIHVIQESTNTTLISDLEKSLKVSLEEMFVIYNRKTPTYRLSEKFQKGIKPIWFYSGHIHNINIQRRSRK